MSYSKYLFLCIQLTIVSDAATDNATDEFKVKKFERELKSEGMV